LSPNIKFADRFLCGSQSDQGGGKNTPCPISRRSDIAIMSRELACRTEDTKQAQSLACPALTSMPLSLSLLGKRSPQIRSQEAPES
jgi:hypothetical protein